MQDSNAIEYGLQETSGKYWETPLYTGQPNHESDLAWVEIMKTSAIRLESDEAEKLGLSHAAPLPNGGRAAMFGLYHNLHCLRRFRQSMSPEYYYANRTEEERKVDEHHDRHCLEAIRTSVMCRPDLTIMPLVWGTEKSHPLNLSPQATRECVNWDKLIDWSRPRAYKFSDIEDAMKELGREIPV